MPRVVSKGSLIFEIVNVRLSTAFISVQDFMLRISELLGQYDFVRKLFSCADLDADTFS